MKKLINSGPLRMVLEGLVLIPAFTISMLLFVPLFLLSVVLILPSLGWSWWIVKGYYRFFTNYLPWGWDNLERQWEKDDAIKEAQRLANPKAKSLETEE